MGRIGYIASNGLPLVRYGSSLYARPRFPIYALGDLAHEQVRCRAPGGVGALVLMSDVVAAQQSAAFKSWTRLRVRLAGALYYLLGLAPLTATQWLSARLRYTCAGFSGPWAAINGTWDLVAPSLGQYSRMFVADPYVFLVRGGFYGCPNVWYMQGTFGANTIHLLGPAISGSPDGSYEPYGGPTEYTGTTELVGSEPSWWDQPA